MTSSTSSANMSNMFPLPLPLPRPLLLLLPNKIPFLYVLACLHRPACRLMHRCRMTHIMAVTVMPPFTFVANLVRGADKC